MIYIIIILYGCEVNHGGITIRADLIIDGNASVNKNLLTAGSIAVKSGTVTLGDSEAGTVGGLRVTSKGVQFYSESSLRLVGAINSIVLCKKDGAVTFHPGSVLDIREGSLVLNQGRLLLHGVLILGCLENDPILLNYVGIGNESGKAVLGNAFSVRVPESLRSTYLDNPDDIVENALVINAVVTRFTYTPGELWQQVVSTPTHLFTLTALLGLPPASGGGLRLSCKRVYD